MNTKEDFLIKVQQALNQIDSILRVFECESPEVCISWRVHEAGLYNPSATVFFPSKDRVSFSEVITLYSTMNKQNQQTK